MIKPILLSLLLALSLGLTGDEIAAICYCDLTTTFCDFGCCCDSSCSSNTDNSCLDLTSQICLEPQFYYDIKTTDIKQDTTSTNCYDYTETAEIQEEVTPSTSQILSYIKKAEKLIPLTNEAPSQYNGYEANVVFTAGGTSEFEFIQSDGSCLPDSSTMSNLHFTLKFMNDLKMTCQAPSNSIKMFTSFLGKTVYRYYLYANSSQTVTIPSSMPSGHNELHIYFVLGTYGSQRMNYIREVQTKTRQNTATATRTLVLKYINPYTDYDREQDSPSFFPQIPHDIFYPIQQLVYTF